MTDYTARPRTELVRILMQLAGHYGKRYCFPSQDKICALYRAHTGHDMSRRALNRHLGALEAEGWIKRQCRHQLDKRRGWVFRSTLYTFSRRAMRFAASAVAALTIWAANPAESRGDSPCAAGAPQSVSSRQDHSRPPPSGWPGEPQKVALEQLQRIKGLLSR